MCGFVGQFLFDASPGAIDLSDLAARAQLLAHRGPDENGLASDPAGRWAMAFRRLGIFDIPHSHQPMQRSIAGVTITLVFNGEIFNFNHLRQDLASQGVMFATEGDTEVLLALYLRDGLGMLDKLVGPFAIAIADPRDGGRLILARDRMGQKPLWYAATETGIHFASEAKALLPLAGINKSPNVESISQYITMGYVSSQQSVWRGIHKLPPASVLEVSSSVGQANRWWQADGIDIPADRADRVDLVRQTVTTAVADRLLADPGVPVGVLLSGGVDSGVVTAAMARRAEGHVRAFTAGFEEGAYDERTTARAVADELGCEHTELLISPELNNVCDRIVDLYDEPFADSSALATDLICRAASQHVTVALCGDGGDEIFGGYDRYRAMRLSRQMGPITYAGIRLLGRLISPLAPHRQRSRRRRFVRFASGLPYPPGMQYLRYRQLFSAEDLERLFADDFLETHQPDLWSPTRWFCDLYEDQGERADEHFGSDDEALVAQLDDIATYLPDDLLVKADIASMGNSLVLRSPLLDHRVVELALSLPAEDRIAKQFGRPGGVGKAILREAFADALPADVFRGGKRGFGIPLATWLRGPLRDEMCDRLMSASFLEAGIFRPESIVGLINDHLGRRDDHSHRLWALMVFQATMASGKLRF
jgi:asparagine synthase (glutamine-hydrolysing)